MHVIRLPILRRVSALTLRQWYDCSNGNEFRGMWIKSTGPHLHIKAVFFKYKVFYHNNKTVVKIKIASYPWWIMNHRHVERPPAPKLYVNSSKGIEAHKGFSEQSQGRKQGFYSRSGKTSCRTIWRSLEAVRFGLNFSNRIKISPRQRYARRIFRVIRSLQHQISRLWDFPRFGVKTSYHLVNRGPG